MNNTKPTVATKLEQQEKAIAEAKGKAQKIKAREAERLRKIFDDEGFYRFHISDEDLRNSIKLLVKNASLANRANGIEPKETVSENA